MLDNRFNRVCFPSQSGVIDLPMKKSGPKRRIPMAMIRQIAMDSSEGGRVHCDYCGHTFSANYCDLVHKSSFVLGHACNDCRRERQLVRA